LLGEDAGNIAQLGEEEGVVGALSGAGSGPAGGEVLSLLHPIQPPGGIGLDDAGDLVADAAEDGELLFFAAGGVRGVVETSVMAVHLKMKMKMMRKASSSDRRARSDFGGRVRWAG
jgi:hypothetical protein